jgi:apolipoprotein D and lipocalin family protein
MITKAKTGLMNELMTTRSIVRRISIATLALVVALPVAIVGCDAINPASLTSNGGTNIYGNLKVVDDFELDRYLGKWYEIARYPNSFEENCYNVTAEYLKISDDRIRVINTCYEGSFDGPRDVTSGTARAVGPAKLAVTFFWPFAGDYWVLDLGDDYEYAVVGEPNRQFFWILSRTPTMDDETFNRILDQMPSWGYNPDFLIYTPQESANESEEA